MNMKKTLISLILIGLLATGLFISTAAADTVSGGPPEGCTMSRDVGITNCSQGQCSFTENSACGMCCLLQTIYNVTDWFFVALVALTTALVIYGAFLILTAGDSDEKVGKGRKWILYAALGLLIAFLAKAVPQIVKMVSGFGQ
jgi:hypothetical protein